MTDNYLIAMSPRCGKSVMQEAMDAFIKSLGKSYDEAYTQVFNEWKKECGDEFSDLEIHAFIQNHLYFDLQVEETSFNETPTITIVPKWRQLELEEDSYE